MQFETLCLLLKCKCEDLKIKVPFNKLFKNIYILKNSYMENLTLFTFWVNCSIRGKGLICCYACSKNNPKTCIFLYHTCISFLK